MKIICSWRTLGALAKAEADAIRSGDPERIAKAKAEYEDYQQMCLKADGMVIGMTVGAHQTGKVRTADER